MLMQGLLKDCDIRVVNNGAAAGTGNVNGSVVDMNGWSNMLILAQLSTSKSGSVMTVRALAGQTSGSVKIYTTGEAMASYTSTGVAVEHHIALDIVRPKERYIQPRLTRATQNATVHSITCILYNSRKAPTTSYDTTLRGTGHGFTPST